ncbi:MAG: hypothetical protein ACREIA_08175 [Opitutaceae bacterium]
MTTHNTYQARRLANGEAREVLKNFPDEKTVCRFLAPHAATLGMRKLAHYWCAWGDLRA